MNLKSVTGFIILILFACFFNSCSKDNETIPLIENKYVLKMTSDFQIREVTFFASDTLHSVKSYNYTEDKIVMLETDANGQTLSKSIYYLTNHLADSCIDSSYHDARLNYVMRYQYAYDINGYKTFENVTVTDYTNGPPYYSSTVSFGYNYTEGNSTSMAISAGCSYYYSYTSLENKINISTFIGDYCGKINKNLRKTYNSGCHSTPSTVPESSEYSYILNEQGWVTLRIEIHSSSYHTPDSKPEKKEIRTAFEYLII